MTIKGLFAESHSLIYKEKGHLEIPFMPPNMTLSEKIYFELKISIIYFNT